MNFEQSADREADRTRTRRSADQSAPEPILAPPFAGPTALRPAAVLQRQVILGNAHVGRVFRSPAGPAGHPGPDEHKECNCPDAEQCNCPK